MGYTGTLGLNIGTGDKYGGQFSLSLRNDKMNIYGNYGYNIRTMTSSGYSDLTYVNNSYLSLVSRDNSGSHRGKSYNVKLGMDYSFDKLNILGLSFNYRNQNRTSLDKNFNTEFDNSANQYRITSPQQTE